MAFGKFLSKSKPKRGRVNSFNILKGSKPVTG